MYILTPYTFEIYINLQFYNYCILELTKFTDIHMLHIYSSIYNGDWSPASSRLLNPFLCREAIPFSKGKNTERGAKSRK